VNPALHRAVFIVGAGQVARTQQKFSNDFAAREHEGLLEQLDPVFFRPGMVLVEPRGKGSVLPPDFQDPPRILARRFHLEPVADDCRIGKQPRLIGLAIGRHSFEDEAFVGLLKSGSLAEDRGPGKSRLVDFEDKAFEQTVVVAQRESVLMIVIVHMFVTEGTVSHRTAVAHGVFQQSSTSEAIGR
jgi:hypothetical protein